MKNEIMGAFGVNMSHPTHIVKELNFTIPMTELCVDIVKNVNISNMIGEFFNDNKSLRKNSISSIINELLTNGLKYSCKNSDIKINTYMENDTLCILMENICTKKQLDYLDRYLETVVNSRRDVHELYMNRVIHLSNRKNIKRAQLGLISLISNFGCMLDIQTHSADNTYIVSTKVSFQGV
jgi:hypothetical protein